MMASTYMTAQTTSPHSPVAATELIAKGIDVNTWSFFSDEEGQVYYIDFETINVNLNEIVVKNKAGKTVYEQNVSDLPVDSIFELDCSEFPTGQYIIELHSYTEVLRKTFSK